eukprot:CAMPEP_0206178552 /NCGR_PEP_ID=MMETSP1474-20131121/64640_1 /ASSEMBLY_ACC=CAM_ASM_001110 /TAXON_ID=97495 /ORGANISM="Imantonia sp., Strain RCC918" /LENGTH=90 /DNA_ID=CAMNT_0053591127 /DNA_START=897 /DNA_END=1166 /DNA_ORIENTATION=+
MKKERDREKRKRRREAKNTKDGNSPIEKSESILSEESGIEVEAETKEKSSFLKKLRSVGSKKDNQEFSKKSSKDGEESIEEANTSREIKK